MAGPGAAPLAGYSTGVDSHSYASLAADLGLADATIAALLGHKGHSVTRRYIRAAHAGLLAAADALAEKTMDLMGVAVDGRPAPAAV